MSLTGQGRRVLRRTLLVGGLAACVIADFPCRGIANPPDPGDVIGPHNWSRVQGLVGENLLNRIRSGYTLRIKHPRKYAVPAEYRRATETYSGKVVLGAGGELVNYVAGLPFPNIAPSDPRAGLKLAWNFYWRWLGDDSKTGGAMSGGKIVRVAIERDGSERRADVVHYYLKVRGRVSIASRPSFHGYEHIDWMQLRADEYPRDTSGTTTLEIRYAQPDREDDLYVYVPSIRRVRRSPPIQRCSTLAPSEFTFDDINNFNGKITDFNYRLLGEKKVLGNFFQEHVPFRRRPGDYLPLDETWEVHDTYVLEITPKNPAYCYAKKIVHIDKLNYEALWTMSWDGKGNYWKEQFPFLTPVTLSDGQEVLSVGTVAVVNVLNGRSTLVTATRAYNQGYQPTLFTLATLQTVMRGGAIR
ncbi:MAG TPA: DUF1329 domain-containing protein [candidate division Zixibacteria bacterium]|nr:DUF1329 domain-containing protein [candidate division Zixibacteria bacterium]